MNNTEVLSSLKIWFYLFLFVNNVVVFKLVNFFGIQLSAASLVFPATYLIITIITIAYGPKEAKKLVFQSVYINIIFGFLIGWLINLPSQNNFNNQAAFLFVFNDIFKLCVAHSIIAPASYLLNIYLLKKLKFLYQSKYFIIRTATSSLIAELFLTVFMVIYSWNGLQSPSRIVHMIFSTYSSKLIWAILGAYPALFIIKLIQKNSEQSVTEQMLAFSERKLNTLFKRRS